MEKHIQIVFPQLKETVLIKVDNSQSPNTVKAILDNLPIEVNINKWGNAFLISSPSGIFIGSSIMPSSNSSASRTSTYVYSSCLSRSSFEVTVLAICCRYGNGIYITGKG